jgi:hypothetical protein
MRIRKIIVIAFSTVAILIALATLLIAIMSYAKVSIPLEGVRQQFIKKASEVAGHEVRIDGEVRLAISFYPTLVVDQLHIANDQVNWNFLRFPHQRSMSTWNRPVMADETGDHSYKQKVRQQKSPQNIATLKIMRKKSGLKNSD